MGKADLHIHTSYSIDSSASVPAVLEWAVSIAELDVIAITDHDTFDGALEAVRRGPEFGIEVIPGCEISTRDGHLLGLFLEKPVRPGLSMHETVLRVGEQGGLCVVAHPTAVLAHGATHAVIANILRDPEAARTLVGIETNNSGILFQFTNRRAQKINDELQLSSTGSSDSHVIWTIGMGYTEFSGYTANDLKTALLTRATTAYSLIEHRSLSYWGSHMLHRTLRQLGWVTWMAEPHAEFVFRRLAEINAH